MPIMNQFIAVAKDALPVLITEIAKGVVGSINSRDNKPEIVSDENHFEISDAIINTDNTNPNRPTVNVYFSLNIYFPDKEKSCFKETKKF